MKIKRNQITNYKFNRQQIKKIRNEKQITNNSKLIKKKQITKTNKKQQKKTNKNK